MTKERHYYTMLAPLIFSALTAFQPDVTYFTVWMQGAKIGYSSYASESIQYQGKPAEKSTSKTELKVGLIGSPLEMTIDSETITVSGKPVQMHFVQSSGGRQQVMDAWFEPKAIRVEVDNNGAKTKETLQYPKDGTIVDDPVAEFALHPTAAGATKTFYILDPTTVSLVKNTAKLTGKEDITVNGRQISANAILIADPRMNTTVYTSGKGDIVKITTTIGMEMVPATKEEAMGKVSTNNQPDIADLTSVKPSVPIENPLATKNLRIRLSADNLPQIPNDPQQRSRPDGKAWIINVRPTQLKDSKTVSIDVAKKQQPDWIKPSLHIPADSPRFTKLAKTILKKDTDVKSAALDIRNYVNSIMTPNAGIGVLRDASEVLDAKEGVCRDYAILTVTLCRAAGIPARLASGLVNFEGNFYYHAWVEVWTGYDWLGLDSVPSSDFFTATHVKLSQGNVDQAFTFTILANAHMEVLEQKS